MTVHDAISEYSLARAKQQKHIERCHRCRAGWTRGAECHRVHQAVDAASITLDLAVSSQFTRPARRPAVATEQAGTPCPAPAASYPSSGEPGTNHDEAAVRAN